ncbi:MAG: hypothetical protein LBC37_00440 [Zoogloeaceae bacterium]|jgi:hypothetical protein|nr:hypothetical protein [Zoogloeaceae bacterium]
MSKDDWKQLLLLVGLAGIGISVMVFSVRSLCKKYTGDNWIWGQALRIWLLGTLAVFFLSFLPFVLVEPDLGVLAAFFAVPVWTVLFALLFAFVMIAAVIVLKGCPWQIMVGICSLIFLACFVGGFKTLSSSIVNALWQH